MKLNVALKSFGAASAPLILAGSVNAGFTGITTESVTNEYGLLVVRVFANFDNPGQDHMLTVWGQSEGMGVEVIGGTFYQHQFGNDKAPPTALINVFPELAYDTFATIGIANTPPNDQLIFCPGWHGFGASAFELNNTDSNYTVVPNMPQGDPFNPAYVAGDGRILIGQFSTADGVGFEGQLTLAFTGDGVYQYQDASFQHPAAPACPGDCADSDGVVGIVDFLAMIAGWDTESPCDSDGGGVGMTDFLALLATWGPCP